MRRATGPSKNILLTLWLLLPFAVLALIVTVIFTTYGNTKMNARPVGPGAGDTGGANAIGELLAGNDPDERARRNRDVREGRLIDPLDWPAGINLHVGPAHSHVPLFRLYSWTGDPGEAPVPHLTFGPSEPVPTQVPRLWNVRPSDRAAARVGAGTSFTKAQLERLIGTGRPGAGFYVTPSAEITSSSDGLRDAQGNDVTPIEFTLRPASPGDSPTEPLGLYLVVDFDQDPPTRWVDPP